LASQETSLSWRVRRFLFWLGMAIAIAIAGYWLSKCLGHPTNQWAHIYSTLPKALQWGPVSALVGALVRLSARTQASRALAMSKFLTSRSDHIAAMLEVTIRAELDKRGLVRPRPLPIRWRRVERRHDEHGTAALIRRPLLAPQPFDTAASLYLSGTGQPRGNRIVLIGAPGSGKSALTLSLQMGLVRNRAEGGFGRVPVVMPLSTWNPDEEPFTAWAAARLREVDPELNRTMRVTRDRTDNAAERMIADGKVMLILDAMDEMAGEGLSRAFARINAAGELVDQPLIVTCRTADYERSLASPTGQELDDALVLELVPPDRETVAQYLIDSGGQPRRSQWQEALAELRRTPDAPIWRTLDTPLMVWLASRVFAADPASLPARLADPALATSEDIEHYLLTNLVPSVFAEAKTAVRWPGDRAERWLRFLASWVQSREGVANQKHERGSKKTDTEPDNGQDIAWWRLGEAPQARRFTRLMAGLFGGLTMGGAVALGIWCVFWNRYDHGTVATTALFTGAVFALAMGPDCARQTPPPTSSTLGLPKWNWGAPGYAGLVTVVIAATAGAFATGSTSGVAWGPVVAFPAVVAYAFGTPYVDTAKVSTPKALYRSDIQQTVIYTIGYAASLGMFAGLYHGWAIGLAMAVLGGAAGGFTYGVIYSVVYKKNIPGVVAWLRFRFAHLWLFAHGHLPLRLFAFLEDAHKLGVLRQNGAAYQFHHLKLRDALAAADDPA
jgi:hypothetical protein